MSRRARYGTHFTRALIGWSPPRCRGKGRANSRTKAAAKPDMSSSIADRASKYFFAGGNAASDTRMATVTIDAYTRAVAAGRSNNGAGPGLARTQGTV